MASRRSWWDERLALGAARRVLLDKPVGQLGWLFTFGGTLVFLLGLQLVTGILLAIYYVASPDHAHQSVTFIMQAVPLGSLIRGLHFWGASLLVVLAVLHVLRVILHGSYKAPREATWVVGVGLLLVILAFAFTGYLLPWDQKAYWATVVGTYIAGTVPWVGDLLLQLLRGGSDVGGATLTRFYAVHVLVLPAAAAVLVLLHLYLVQLHGISGPPERSAEERVIPFYPYHAVRDVAVIAVVYALLVWLASFVPAPLEGIADPTDAAYVPRPEWYFYPLYEILKFFGGRWLVVGTVVIPVALVLLLFLLPFLDRSPHRDPFARPIVTSATLSLIVGGVYLMSIGAASGPQQEFVFSEGSVPPVRLAGALLFEEKSCESCHSILGRGGRAGPDLWKAGERHDAQWLTQLFKDPDSLLPKGSMPRFDLPARELTALVDYVQALDFSRRRPMRIARALARGGGEMWRSGCLECHRMEGTGGAVPALNAAGRRRSYEWLEAYLARPDFRAHGGARLPPLSAGRKAEIARYLASQVSAWP